MKTGYCDGNCDRTALSASRRSENFRDPTVLSASEVSLFAPAPELVLVVVAPSRESVLVFPFVPCLSAVPDFFPPAFPLCHPPARFAPQSASAFDQPITSWDTSSVVNFDFMFMQASSFDQPLDSWDVSSVKHMTYMFYDASSYNQPLAWDVSAVSYMGYMFHGAVSFKQKLCGAAQLLSPWGCWSTCNSLESP